MKLIEAFNIMRKAAENSMGTLAYHQKLQSAIEIIAQVVIRERDAETIKEQQFKSKETYKET
jgi:hypothetical protein